MIKRDQLRDYLRAILKDLTPGVVEFDDAVMNPAINEAVIAVARLRPEEFATVVSIAWDASSNAYKLDPAYDRILYVHGTLRDGQLRALKPRTPGEATDENPCWPHGEDPATHFIWTAHDPRRVYINGERDATEQLRATVSQLPGLDSSDGDIALSISYLPDVVDHTFKRLYQIESNTQGIQQYHDQLFRQGISNKLSADNSRSPVSAMLESTKNAV